MVVNVKDLKFCYRYQNIPLLWKWRLKVLGLRWSKLLLEPNFGI